MSHRHVVRGLLAALVVGAVGLGAASPADAATTRTWNTYAEGVAVPRGYAETQVTIGFPGPKSFRFKAMLDDVCPADGRAASLTVKTWDGAILSRRATYRNTKGCDEGLVFVGTKRFTSVNGILAVEVTLCDYLPSNGQADGCETWVWKNPAFR